ncbi:unnamed protein product [Parascedosporium putredinis]|uniref:Uncharacterized protein n=1 Tax=Parascedosporium putredinis TaxID=1442378 RepID=A0A9P1GU90_9PEZI|nr:unnamed protein product [Parascedosporium putredinis]CAI7987497.1 unnamed protein product [Parascedosporium putredinis]
MADDEHLLTRAQGLSDLELAFLISLMSREHCIITTHPSALNNLLEELQLVCPPQSPNLPPRHKTHLLAYPRSTTDRRKTFGLNSVIIDCHPTTTLDDFVSALLLSTQQPPPSQTTSPSSPRRLLLPHPPPHPRRLGPRPLSPSTPSLAHHPRRRRRRRRRSFHHRSRRQPSSPATFSIAELVLARNLDRAPKAVQIQALELLRTRRVFTRTAVQAAPKTFLFVPVLTTGRARNARRTTMGLTPHLNDLFFISHYHDLEDGFPASKKVST